MATKSRNDADAALASLLAKLWPHRSHESSRLKNLPCGGMNWTWANLLLNAKYDFVAGVRKSRWMGLFMRVSERAAESQ